MNVLNEMVEKITQFRDARDWKQFHTPKDMALSLVLEAAEFMEHFQWKRDGEVERYIAENRGALGEELADVLYWVLLISHDLKIPLDQAFEAKMARNEAKYPIEQAKGSAAKYAGAGPGANKG